MTYDVQTPAVARLWPYAPDWSRGFAVQRAFSTDIQASRDGTEQRRALRMTPRLSAEYHSVVSGGARRTADHHLRLWQNKPVTVPDFARWARLTGSSALGASTLTISPMPPWIAADQSLILCGTGNDLEQVLVDSVAGTTVTLADPLVSAWGSGSVIRPTFFGLLNGEIQSSRRNRDAADLSIAVESYPGAEPPRAAGTAWATFNGKEVFTLQPDYAQPPSINYVWPVEQTDVGRGRTAQFRPIEQLARRLEADFNGLGLTTATEVEQFFDRMLGRRNAFYLPTYEQDLVLVGSAGGTAIIVEGDLTELDAFDAVAVCLTDGTQIYRTISSPVLTSGNTQFTVSSAWPVTLTGSNVARISWMPLVRFASDEMTMTWRTPLSAGTRLTFQQVTG